MMTGLSQDVRFGLRMLRKSPGFTAVAILTLALGIGATTAIFSLVSGILLKPLPYPQPDRLIRLLQSYPEKGLDIWRLSPASFVLYRDQNHVFTSVAAYAVSGVNLTGGVRPERLQAAKVTADFFKVMSTPPALGRTFLPGEDTQGRNTVCVLSYGFWKRHFGGNPGAIGKSLALDNSSIEVVGVMPADFKFPTTDTEVWIPLGLKPDALHPWFLTGVARLKPGVLPEAAQREVTNLLLTAGQKNPQLVSRNDPPLPGSGLKATVEPLKQAMTGKTARPLLILQFAAGFILLIACANIANLLLSRAVARAREIALRYSQGATPGRVVQQLLTESLLLSCFGACAGVVLAWWVVRTLSRLPLEGIPRIDEVGISGGVLVFTAAIAVLTGMLFGLVPAIQTYRLGLAAGIKEGQKGSSGKVNRRVNSALVGAQFALSLILLIGAGLVLKSFQRLVTVNAGFRPDHVLTMLLPVTNQKYPSSVQALQFYHGLLEQVHSLPGTTSVGFTSNLPLTGDENSDGYIVEGFEPQDGGDAPQAQLQTVSAGYFSTMGIGLQRGRDFLGTERKDTPLVAVIDETLARRYWPDGNALGKRIKTTGDDQWLTIIGVVKGIKNSNLSEEMVPHLYFPHGQDPRLRMYMVVRTAARPTALVGAVQGKLHDLDPDVPVYSVHTMEEVVDKTLNGQKLINLLLAIFAVLALLLAVVGIYGLMSVYVASRKREIGIRLALGAQPSGLLSGVMKEGLILTVSGIAVGLIASFALTRSIASLLYEVSPWDLTVFTSLPLLLMVVSLAACYWPARRASRTDPLVALRYD
ncbi:MAG TPA: ABC transporter permease [Thermoanaerobaculia bacterium]|nr:ABC transporter permease [Thermoanaerobaculia bacterium]